MWWLFIFSLIWNVSTTPAYMVPLWGLVWRCLPKLRFETKSKTQWVGYFETISGHFFDNYINISHKTEVLIVVLMRLTYLNHYLIKNYDIKHNFCHFCFFQFCKKKKLKNHNSQMAILWPFLAIFLPSTYTTFTKLRFWWSF